jgi:hypothetical protein
MNIQQVISISPHPIHQSITGVGQQSRLLSLNCIQIDNSPDDFSKTCTIGIPKSRWAVKRYPIVLD